MAEATCRIESAKENVLIRAGRCSLTSLPHLGGKIASIRVNDCELLQAPLAAYAPRTRTMPFDASDASGWDECLPSVADCTVETAAGPAAVPDHGDLWRVAWMEVSKQASEDASASSITLRGECFSLPLTLERKVALSETAKGWRLSLDYKLTNTGSYSLPWSWAAHPLFAVEAGDRIVLPDSIRELHLEGCARDRLGKCGARVAWPIATLAAGGKTDLRVAQPPESGIGDKLFAGPLSAAENWCALERPKAGVRVKVSFDPAATPYLGLWICYGGWPERPGPKQTCVALEPATAPVDSLAQTGPWSRVLAPGHSFSWPMIVDIESI
ncbi:MAG: aldose epimerase [Terracidiphilus sp.]|jgi:galactose mutarotase-like enzyme